MTHTRLKKDNRAPGLARFQLSKRSGPTSLEGKKKTDKVDGDLYFPCPRRAALGAGQSSKTKKKIREKMAWRAIGGEKASACKTYKGNPNEAWLQKRWQGRGGKKENSPGFSELRKTCAIQSLVWKPIKGKKRGKRGLKGVSHPLFRQTAMKDEVEDAVGVLNAHCSA